MSSPSDCFECRWQGSRQLLTAYLAGWGLAVLCLAVVSLPLWLRLSLMAVCLVHAGWVIPRRILLTHPCAITGLRRDACGWQLFSRAQGWQAVQLRRDSLALPGMVVLRFVRKGRCWVETQCVAGDGLAREQHRRLRVRLKFSRRRWSAPGA